MAAAEQVERNTLKWLNDTVIGLGLCPFAKPVLESGGVRIRVVEGLDEEEAMAVVMEEMRALVESSPEDSITSMVVTPHICGEFEAYLALVEELEDVLVEVGADHLVQIATFHPNYAFEGVPQNARSNHTNRSPYPIFHLLRQEDVEEALEGWREPMRIPERNINLLEKMTEEAFQAHFGGIPE